MGVISTMNGVSNTDIDKVNGKLNSDINTINGQDLTNPSSVTISLDSSTTMLNDGIQDQDGYRGVNITGMQSGDVISIYVGYNCSTLTGSATVDFYYRQSDYNSNLWQTIASYDFTSGTGTGSTTITDIDFNDAVDLRVDVYSPLGSTGAGTISISGGTFTTGTGTVSTSSPTSFSLSIT